MCVCVGGEGGNKSVMEEKNRKGLTLKNCYDLESPAAYG